LQAKELLETSYLKNRTDSELESELQSFYFYAKDKKGLEQFIAKLSLNSDGLSNSWLALQKAIAN